LPKKVIERWKNEADDIPKVFINRKRHTVEVLYEPHPDRVSREIKKSV